MEDGAFRDLGEGVSRPQHYAVIGDIYMEVHILILGGDVDVYGS